MFSIDNFMLVLSATLAGSLMLIGGIITCIYAIKRNNRLIYLFSVMWLLYSVFWFIDAAAHYYYSTFLMAIAILPQLVAVPCVVVFIELSRKENVSPVKIVILFVIEFLLLFFTFLPGGREVIPGYGVHNVGILRIVQIVFILYFVSLYFIWSYQTWKRSPHQLKRLTNWLLFGSTLFSLITALGYALGTLIRIFNSIAFIVNGVGALITILVILKDPRIIFILPFKAYRLIIFETKDGTPLFKHDWAELRDIEENIFAMLLQATRKVLNEILNKGEVRKIDMDKAVLLIQYDKRSPIASVLVASKSSKSLRNGLKVFHDQFISKYYTEKEDFHNINKFKDAKNLIKTVFEFIPEYI